MDPIRKAYGLLMQAMIRKLSKTKMPPRRIRASELGACKRKVYYRLAGFIPALKDKPWTAARLADYGRDGDLHHDSVRNMLREGGAKIGGIEFGDGTTSQAETLSYKLNVEHNHESFVIAMRLDGTIRIGNMIHLLEIKSLGYWKFKKMLDMWCANSSDAALAGFLQAERKDIIFQIHACMVAAKMKRTYLVFKDRSECAVGFHHNVDPDMIIGGPIIPFKPAIWTQVKNRCATVARALRTDVPPAPEFTSGTKECSQQCPYLHLCHGADKRRAAKQHPAMMHPQLGTKLHVEDL